MLFQPSFSHAPTSSPEPVKGGSTGNAYVERAHSWQTAAQAALLVSAAALCILLAPLPPPFQRPLICADVLSIGNRAHILVNCDSESFVELARDPSTVLETNSVRQTRPGYGAIAWLMSFPFRAVNQILELMPAQVHRLMTAPFDPYYAGCVTLNWISLIVALMLLADLIGARSLLDSAAVVPVSILLVNHITKAFFWTPHQQVIGLSSAVIAMWIARRTIIVEGRVGVPAAAGLGLVSGAACLVYGAFVLVPASGTIALWLFCNRKTRNRKVRLTSVLWLGTVAPLIAWYTFIIERTGSFYSRETSYYHEFVWIAERLNEGFSSLLAALWKNLASFLGTFPAALGLPIAFLGLAFLLAVTRNKRFPKASIDDVAVMSALSFLLAAVPFYSLMGFYDPRLTAALAAPLVVLAGSALRDAFRELNTRPNAIVPEPITLAAVAYIAIVVLIRGPYA